MSKTSLKSVEFITNKKVIVMNLLGHIWQVEVSSIEENTIIKEKEIELTFHTYEEAIDYVYEIIGQ